MSERRMLNRVLITGGAGFIGSNLAQYLRSRHPETRITVLDDLSSGSSSNISGMDVDFVHGSILDTDLLAKVMHGQEAVVHLAAIPSVPRSVADPVPSHAANATGTLMVVEEARQQGVQQVIVASSSSVYGSNPSLPKSEWDWTRPMSPYGVSKLATEGYALAYNYSYGMKNLAFRFFNVYGPGQPAGHAYAAVIPAFLDAALRGEPVQVHGDGMQSRDFTFVETICAVMSDALTRSVSSNDPVNLAFGTNTSLMELIGELKELLNFPLEVEHSASRIGDVRASQSDGVQIRELFPEIEPVGLKLGLAKTLNWFDKELRVNR